MQHTETGRHESESVEGYEQSDAAQDDLAVTEPTDFAEGVFAAIDQGKAVENKAGRGDEGDGIVVQKGKTKYASRTHGDGYLPHEEPGGFGPELLAGCCCLAPGEIIRAAEGYNKCEQG